MMKHASAKGRFKVGQKCRHNRNVVEVLELLNEDIPQAQSYRSPDELSDDTGKIPKARVRDLESGKEYKVPVYELSALGTAVMGGWTISGREVGPVGPG